MIDTVFICKANVGRSQMAEAIYNDIKGGLKSMSMAGSEARKEKYNSKPSHLITKELEKNDLSVEGLRISYLSDMDIDVLNGVEKIVFLFDPTAENTIDPLCKLESLSVYEYMNKYYPEKIIIQEIEDPYDQNEHNVSCIFQEIKYFIEKL